MPVDYCDPAARVARLDAFGIDVGVCLPNCGIMWELALVDDVDATKANMEAWNRYAVEVARDYGRRLSPVGHVTLRDPAFLEEQVRMLADGGVKLAMVAPALVDGRRLSHPEHERMWAAFAEHDVGVVFHVAQYPPVFDPAWNEGDPDWSNPVLSSVFMWTAPALAIADLAVHGVFARHPALRLGVIELMSAWVPQFLLMLDGGFEFHAKFNGAPLCTMEGRPSDYVRRQVRVASFAFEHPDRLRNIAGDIFMFGSDYPHPEGLARPLADFVERTGIDPVNAPALYHDNAAWLLGMRG
jgi:predicted TIM-barrel fold metal-dependent hydrolase